ncbi:hypothetical protein BHM03_00049245 [Ensete ventricosum]|nr:hypothetical protein BHM03_00049245 [Ensete ventricosum]
MRLWPVRPPTHDCAAATGVRGRNLHKRYCTRWPHDAAPISRDCHLMRLRSIVYGRPACGRRLMRLPPTRDQPKPSVALLTAADLCAHAAQCSAAADRSDQNPARLLHLFHGAQKPLRSFTSKRLINLTDRNTNRSDIQI